MSIYDILTSTGYQFDGYTIDTYPVAFVDNEGEPCGSCQMEGRTVSHTIYGVMSYGGPDVVMGCCTACVLSTIKDMDPTVDVTVEFGLLAVLVDVLDNNTMCGPDCGCIHPDGI